MRSQFAFNAAREERADACLTALEAVGRNLEHDYDDPAYADGQFMRQCLQSDISKLNTMYDQAKPDPQRSAGFLDVLSRSHSFREQWVAAEYKDGVRQKRKCMGCGRFEKNCNYKISLAGPYDRKGFCGNPRELNGAYREFRDTYVKPFDKDYCTDPDELMEEDYGDYMLGSTCIRKARLTFLVNTFMMEKAYKADVEMQKRADEGRKIGRGEVYTVNDESIQEYIEELHQLQCCIGEDCKRPLPEILVNDEYWELIDEQRDVASGGKEVELIELIRKRAYQSMNKPCGDASSDEEADDAADSDNGVNMEMDELSEIDTPMQKLRSKAQHYNARNKKHFVASEDDDEGEEEERAGPRKEGPGRAQRKKQGAAAPKRRKSRVVHDSDDSEYEEEEDNEDERVDGEVSGAVSSRTRLAKARMDDPVEVVEVEGVEVEDAGSVGEEEDGVEGEEQGDGALESNHPRLHPRKARPSAADFAAAKRKPSVQEAARTEILCEATKLKLRLMREGRREDSSVMTQCIALVEELMDESRKRKRVASDEEQ